jgi:hypothetical protein
MAIRSKQPRFKTPDFSESDIMSLYDFLGYSFGNEPAYSADSRKRDEWLINFLPQEPYLMGIMKSVIDIDKNRGWRLVGGRNQVSRFTKIFHSFQAAPGLKGWRPALSMASQSFWGTNMGAVVEIGKSGKDGPMRALYTVDPTTCKLTGNPRKPLKYIPAGSRSQDWQENEFIRVASMPHIMEKYRGLGYCAVERCVELAKLMIAVYEHDREQLGAKAPRGLLLLKCITQKNWETAMIARDAKAESKGYNYFGPIAVLASPNASADMKLLALSQLPTSFNLREWVDMLVYGYALCWGYDASEFIPVQFGAIGRGTETEVQHEKATGKGRLDFVLGFQEQLQRPDIFPDSLEFAFDQRDEKGDLLHAQVNQAWSNVGKTLLDNGLSTSEVKVLLADWGVIPRAWAPTDSAEATDREGDNDPSDDISEDEIIEDNDDDKDYRQPEEVKTQKQETKLMRMYKEELLSRQPVHQAAQKFRTEPIVMYMYPSNTVLTLWESGDELLKQKIWHGI